MIVLTVLHGYTDRFKVAILLGAIAPSTVLAIEAKRNGRPIPCTYLTHAAANSMALSLQFLRRRSAQGHVPPLLSARSDCPRGRPGSRRVSMHQLMAPMQKAVSSCLTDGRHQYWRSKDRFDQTIFKPLVGASRLHNVPEYSGKPSTRNGSMACPFATPSPVFAAIQVSAGVRPGHRERLDPAWPCPESRHNPGLWPPSP